MPVPQNAQAIWNFLLQQGFNQNAAAGIEGNIEQESGGDPRAGTNPPGAGLIQILGDPGGSLQSELQKTMTYIRQNGSVQDINAHASTPQSAALWFSTRYERPLASAANNPNREQSAADVLAAARSGNWQTTSGPVQNATPTSFGIPGLNLPFPFNLFPGLGGSSNPINDISNSIGSIFEKGIQKAFGVASFKDLWERLGLILLGVVLIIVGIHILATGSRQAERIDVINQIQGSSGGARKKGSKPTSTTTAVPHAERSAATAGGLRSVGAGDAIEAAAVALCRTVSSLMVMVPIRSLMS